MANAIKCTNCGEFEESLGYSVRIYKHVKGTDSHGNSTEYSKRVVTEDCLCSSCASKVADALGADLEEE